MTLPDLERINESALDGIKAHRDGLVRILLTGGLTESAEKALEDSIKELDTFIAKEKILKIRRPK